MGAVSTIVKGLFLIFNFVFWALGLALLVVGILAKFQFAYIMKLSTDVDLDLAPYILIGCGVFIVLVGFMGCWASIKEHGWALKLYMFVLIVLFIAEVAGAIAGYIMRGKVSGFLKSAIESGVDNYYKDADKKDAMDMFQSKIHCCGVTTYKDYLKHSTNTTVGNTTVVTTPKMVPKSCCIKEAGCGYKDVSVNATGIYTDGCFDTLMGETKKNILIIVGVALGIAVFQVFGVLSAFKLTKKFKKNYEKM